ncbi:MAG: hypothetical protein AAGC84_19015 [Pseudomonas sp.]
MSRWIALKTWLTQATRFVGQPQPDYSSDSERQQFEQDCLEVFGYKGDELVMLTERDLLKIWRAGMQRQHGVSTATVTPAIGDNAAHAFP